METEDSGKVSSDLFPFPLGLVAGFLCCSKIEVKFYRFTLLYTGTQRVTGEGGRKGKEGVTRMQGSTASI